MITLYRWYHRDCTISRVNFNGFQCFALELPTLSNEQYISCIPEGEYKYFAKISSTNGNVLELKDVPGRTFIQIHSGNYTRNTQGCILVGDGVKWIDKDKIPDVTNSKNTLNKLLSIAGKVGKITIKS